MDLQLPTSEKFGFPRNECNIIGSAVLETLQGFSEDDTLIRRVADNYKAVQRLSQDAGMTVLALVEELPSPSGCAGPYEDRRAGSVSAAPEYDIWVAPGSRVDPQH